MGGRGRCWIWYGQGCCGFGGWCGGGVFSFMLLLFMYLYLFCPLSTFLLFFSPVVYICFLFFSIRNVLAATTGNEEGCLLSAPAVGRIFGLPPHTRWVNRWVS